MRLVLLCIIALYTFPAFAMSSKPLPWLQVERNHLAKKDGTPVTLRGVSLCSLEWHKPLEQIRQVTNSPLKWDVNVIRLPVQVREWDRVGAQSYIKEYLDPAVAECKKNGVYCIIDWHEIAAWDDPAVVKKLENFWRIVAPRYASHSNILYEIFNEPTTPVERTKENWIAWKTQAQKWVNSIRASAPDTVLLVGSPHWSQMPSFAVEDPFKGDNLVYVMHIYPNWKQGQWDVLFGDAANDIPLFLTEWGWTSQPKNKDVIYFGDKESYGQPLKEYLKNRPFVNWTAWSYDPLCGPAMLGPDKDMGAFVKQWLKEERKP